MKAEVIFLSPPLVREWVEKPEERNYQVKFGSQEYIEDERTPYHSPLRWDKILRNNYEVAVNTYNQHIASLPTYLLVSDQQYKIGQEVEVRLQWQYRKDGWNDCSEKDYNEMPVPLRRIVAYPVQEKEEEFIQKQDINESEIDEIADTDYPTFDQIGGDKIWEDMTELERVYYNLMKAKNAIIVQRNTIKRLHGATAQPEAVRVLKWAAENFDINDGDFYWKEDKEGDKPLDHNEVYKLFKQQQS